MATRKPEIDDLTPASAVLLYFELEDRFEPALFLGGYGNGVDRKARFVSVHPHPDGQAFTLMPYEWEARRHGADWVHGDNDADTVIVSQCYWQAPEQPGAR